MKAGKHETIQAFNEAQSEEDQHICEMLRRVIDRNLPEAESKIWHAHPIWFLDGNPVVGYSWKLLRQSDHVLPFERRHWRSRLKSCGLMALTSISPLKTSHTATRPPSRRLSHNS